MESRIIFVFVFGHQNTIRSPLARSFLYVLIDYSGNIGELYNRGIAPFCSQQESLGTRYLRISSHLKRIILGNHPHPHPHHHPHDCDQDGLIREEARTERVGKDWFSITRRIFLPHTIFYHLPPDFGPDVLGGCTLFMKTYITVIPSVLTQGDPCLSGVTTTEDGVQKKNRKELPQLFILFFVSVLSVRVIFCYMEIKADSA